MQNDTENAGDIVVAALCADLIFAAKIRGAAQAAGVTARLARNADDLLVQAAASEVRLVLVDLDARTGIDAVAKLKSSATVAPVICFVSHVREDAIASARAAGADRVMARSAFVRELPALLATLRS